jgi:hypothetical protein
VRDAVAVGELPSRRDRRLPNQPSVAFGSEREERWIDGQVIEDTTGRTVV